MPPKSISDYINAFPDPVKKRLNALNSAILQNAPQAQEAFAYGIPTYKLNGNLVHFAGYKKHIGFYPAPSGIHAFKDELAGYKTSKGAIQFPHDEPLPLDLVERIVRFRVSENTQQSA